MKNVLLAFLIVGILFFGALLLFQKKDTTSPQNSELSTFSQNQPTNSAQPTAQTTPDDTPLESAQRATLKTQKGDITIQLYPDIAPKTVSNFVKKAKSGYYKNLTFHRVEDWVIQGGDPLGNGTGGGDMTTELSDKPFVVGSVGIARAGDIEISNDSQFFITKTESPHLNNQYTNFGIVTKGIEVVNTIEVGDTIIDVTVE